MKLDLDLELPFDPQPPSPAPRMSTAEYLEFIEFNQQVLRDNGLLEKVISLRCQPVDRPFTME